MAAWEVEYKGHVIRVENHLLGGERLYIDGAACERGHHVLRAELRGRIPGGDGAGEEVVALLSTGGAAVNCLVTVDGKRLFEAT